MRVALIVVALMASLPARAAERVIELKVDAAYRHKPSGLELPASLDGVPRKKAASYGVEQFDDAVQFESEDGAQLLTVYVFRNVTGAVPVWFDRIRNQIERREDLFGTVTAIEGPAAFTPPHQASASALMQGFITGKGPFRGTAAALIPLGPDWYVAVRYSSRTLSAAAIVEHMPAMFAGMRWPDHIDAQPAAELIAPCAAPLIFAPDARQLPPDSASALASAIVLASDAEDGEKAKKREAGPVRWCRDPAAIDANAGVYRPIDSSNSYLLALGDAGRGIWIAPDTIAMEIAKSGPPRWTIATIDLAESVAYPGFEGFPGPTQVVAAINRGKPVATVTTWGKKRQINISSDALK